MNQIAALYGDRGSIPLTTDMALDRYRKDVTDKTRELTATQPDPYPDSLVIDTDAYTGYPIKGDSAGGIKLASDGVAYIDYILEPLFSQEERRAIVARDPDGAPHILDA